MSSEVAHINCSWFPDSTDPNVCVDEQSSVVPTATPSKLQTKSQYMNVIVLRSTSTDMGSKYY